MPVFHYHVLRANCAVELVEKVEPLLREGWKCQGGVCVVAEQRIVRGTTFDREYEYFQAMTRQS